MNPLYKVTRVDKDGKHFYQIESDDKWLPGVTTILKVLNKPALIPWALNCMEANILNAISPGSICDIKSLKEIIKESKGIYKKKAEDAANIGTRIHNAIDAIIHGNNYERDAQVDIGVEGFLRWQEANKLKIILGDTRIASKIFGYGGSLDFLAESANGVVIFDVKTTKKMKGGEHGIYPEYAYQLSAYKQAFEETYGAKVSDVYALWINKETPGFLPLRVGHWGSCFEGFLSCLKLHNLSNYQLFNTAN